ncbi:MAG: hypothetical protein A2X12_01140 [Bacteroidetes bacterium GWE2_29_8]|nr:MAG: hypothetical protein A2X12_01140 [Bacteroidetes bacterium GWE2_29_8]OFY14416.1 MAG: hypothetical protein A2X02_01275 [Bacteroidetes bacterium GWF2_29_10]
MKNKNSIDSLIEYIKNVLSEIPNFKLVQTDPNASKLFNSIVAKYSDIQSFKTLYKMYYIPAANRAIIDTRKELKTSIYKKYIIITDDELKENYYETIRLGYVGLFHKIENFVKEMLVQANLILNIHKEEKDSIENYYKNNYKFTFNNWKEDPIIEKINWISNCEKHYDGFPLKEPNLLNLPKYEKIKKVHEDFYKDIDYVAEIFYKNKLLEIFMLSSFKMIKDYISENTPTDEIKQKSLIFELTVKDYIKSKRI